jgi:uncharacterized protein
MPTDADLLIEGYASLFGRADDVGDVVRAGAFSRSLRGQGTVPMLLQHAQGAIAGRWLRLHEDGYGLFVRGLISMPSAKNLAARGLNGLSIGFRPRLWKPNVSDGRELIDIDLVEVSLVASPCQARARFSVLGREHKQAA